jgi:hypothetical protein
VVRIAIDRANGHFAARQDTMAHGVFTAFSLTDDGATMVMDEGTFDHSVWAISFADAVKGTLPDNRRIAHASTAVTAGISPDGAKLIVRRNLPTTGGHSEIRYSIMPFEGGAETPLPIAGVVTRAKWSDSQHVATSVATASGSVRLSEVDVRGGAQRNVLDLPDSTIADFAAIDGGWAWIPITRDRIIVSEKGHRREYQASSWFGSVFQIAADRARHRALFVGLNRATGDSLGAGVLSLDDGKQTLWSARFAEDARVMASAAHPVVFLVAETQEKWALYALDGPGQSTPLGTIGRPIRGVGISEDLSRATITEMDYRADAWANKVVVH